MNNQTISWKQAGWMLWLNLFAIGIWLLPEQLKNESDSNMLIEVAVILIFIVIYWLGSLFWRTNSHLSFISVQWIRLFLMMMAMMNLLYGCAFILAVWHSTVIAPGIFILNVILVCAGVAYLATLGMTCRAQMSVMLGKLVLFFVICFLFFGFFGLQYMMPPVLSAKEIIAHQLIPHIYQGIMIFFIAENPVMIQRYMRQDKKYTGMSRYMVMAMLMITAIFILIIGYIRAENRADLLWVTAGLMQMIELPGRFISRYDLFFLIGWMIAWLMMLSGLWMQFLDMLLYTLPEKERMSRRWKASFMLIVLMVAGVCIVPFEIIKNIWQIWMMLIAGPVIIGMLLYQGLKWMKVVTSC